MSRDVSGKSPEKPKPRRSEAHDPQGRQKKKKPSEATPQSNDAGDKSGESSKGTKKGMNIKYAIRVASNRSQSQERRGNLEILQKKRQPQELNLGRTFLRMKVWHLTLSPLNHILTCPRRRKRRGKIKEGKGEGDSGDL